MDRVHELSGLQSNARGTMARRVPDKFVKDTNKRPLLKAQMSGSDLKLLSSNERVRLKSKSYAHSQTMDKAELHVPPSLEGGKRSRFARRELEEQGSFSQGEGNPTRTFSGLDSSRFIPKKGFVPRETTETNSHLAGQMKQGTSKRSDLGTYSGLLHRGQMAKNMVSHDTRSSVQVNSWEMIIPGLPERKVSSKKLVGKNEHVKKEEKFEHKAASMKKRQGLSSEHFPNSQGGLPVLNIPPPAPQGDIHDTPISSSLYGSRYNAAYYNQAHTLPRIDASATISNVNMTLKEGGWTRSYSPKGKKPVDMDVQYVHLPKMEQQKSYGEARARVAGQPSDWRGLPPATEQAARYSDEKTGSESDTLPPILYGKPKERVPSKGRILPRI